MIGLWYFTCVFLVTRPFHGYQNFWPCDLDLGVWPSLKSNTHSRGPQFSEFAYFFYFFLLVLQILNLICFWFVDVSRCDTDQVQIWYWLTYFHFILVIFMAIEHSKFHEISVLQTFFTVVADIEYISLQVHEVRL